MDSEPRDRPRGSSEGCVLSDQHHVLAGGIGAVRIWDAATGQLVRTLHENLFFVLSVAFAPDGRQVLAIDKEGMLHLWDANTGQLLRTIQPHPSDTLGVQSIAFSPDGTQILSGGMDQTVKVWDARTGLLSIPFGALERYPK